ncbi:hypothetical protein [Leptospira interrogans]|uniref:hypothetical protein n=1 Tax=Leptospira interrogans TaxID=173 RepID=UPI000AB9D9C4|nr:hypothetical protein [Leptospira interrogans]
MILLFSIKKNLISEANHFEQQNSFYLFILQGCLTVIEKNPPKIDLGNHLPGL